MSFSKISAWAFSILSAWSITCFAQKQITPKPPATPPNFWLEMERHLQEFPASDQHAEPIFFKGLLGGIMSNQDAVLEGESEMRKHGSVIKAKRLNYTRDNDQVNAVGDVYLMHQNNIFTGPEALFYPGVGDGLILEPDYYLGSTGGSGHAQRIEMQNRDKFHATNIRYTGCACTDNPAWELRGDSLYIDNERQIGHGAHGIFYFYGVPIFASPYFSFSLTQKRASGFLTPTLGFNTPTGTQVLLPYYFNIAPNRDMTLTSRFMSRRGLMLSNEFRYLEPKYSGNTSISYIYHDLVTKTNRFAYSLQHQHSLPFSTSAYLNLQGVSDNDYPIDFGADDVIQNGVQRVYPREGGFNWSNGPWSVQASIQKFQTLAPEIPGYERVPKLNLNYRNFNLNGFDLRLNTEYTNFVIPIANHTIGQRVVLAPQLSYPLFNPGWFITPKIKFNASTYQLDNNSGTHNHRQINRFLPTFSLDNGLIFERNTILFGNRWIQTLEPRLFYVYTPFRDQNKIPLFDTTLADFNLAEAFNENVFVGNDRISDANRMTASLSTRFIDAETGVQNAVFLIAQRFNFSTQYVTLHPGQPADNTKFSDMLFGGELTVLKQLKTDFTLQYDRVYRRFNRAQFGLGWRKAPGKVINAFYRYLRPATSAVGFPINQVELSTQWPITHKLYGIGRVIYALDIKAWTDSLFGFEYQFDCWAIKFATQRYSTNVRQFSTRIFAQIEFKGLSSFGYGSADIFEKSIPGYYSTPPQPLPSPFIAYE